MYSLGHVPSTIRASTNSFRRDKEEEDSMPESLIHLDAVTKQYLVTDEVETHALSGDPSRHP